MARGMALLRTLVFIGDGRKCWQIKVGFFASLLLTLLFFSTHSLHVSRHGWKPIWHKRWDLMEKCNGRFKGLPKKEKPKRASLRNFQRGRLYALWSGSGPAFQNAALGDDGGRLCRHSLDTVKVRGAFGERGDGNGVTALTPFNLCWQFQFPAEKDISHSCLKNPNHSVLLINLLAVGVIARPVWVPDVSSHFLSS